MSCAKQATPCLIPCFLNHKMSNLKLRVLWVDHTIIWKIGIIVHRPPTSFQSEIINARNHSWNFTPNINSEIKKNSIHTWPRHSLFGHGCNGWPSKFQQMSRTCKCLTLNYKNVGVRNVTQIIYNHINLFHTFNTLRQRRQNRRLWK